MREAWWQANENTQSLQTEFRVLRPSGELRWCIGTAAAGVVSTKGVRVSGVTVDITDRKLAEERQTLLAREVDHRARNALAVAIVRLTMASNIDGYVAAIEDRIDLVAAISRTKRGGTWSYFVNQCPLRLLIS